RHHGPGSARAVRSALSALAPDAVLIEGPPEADPLVTHVTALIPPVAILAHAPDRPGRAAFWPFADFSPEGQAMRFATETRLPARFVDLPAATVLAGDDADDAEERAPEERAPEERAPEKRAPEELAPEELAHRAPAGLISDDPLGWLSKAAGHDDPERWW